MRRPDVVFFPVDARLKGPYDDGALEFIEAFRPRLFIPMHFQQNFAAAEKFAAKGGGQAEDMGSGAAGGNLPFGRMNLFWPAASLRDFGWANHGMAGGDSLRLTDLAKAGESGEKKRRDPAAFYCPDAEIEEEARGNFQRPARE